MQVSTIRSYIVYLKNIIFFKVIMIFFVILLLAWLLFIFKNDLEISKNRYNFVSNNILELENNLMLISTSKDKLLDNYKKQEKHLNIPPQENCDKRYQLVQKIKKIGAKYNLSNETDVNVIRSFKNNKNSSSNLLKVNYYDCIIHFSTLDLANAINFTREVYSIIPENSVITSIKIKEIETLNQETIARLNQNIKPNLVEINMIINLQEVNYFM